MYRLNKKIDEFISEYVFDTVDFELTKKLIFGRIRIPHHKWYRLNCMFNLDMGDIIDCLREWFFVRGLDFTYIILEDERTKKYCYY
jgi:hypothetical protein